jgi:hypothetical protein
MAIPDWRALAQQAGQLFDQNRWDDAVRLAEQSLTLNPDSTMALRVMGMVLSRRDQPREAIPLLERAVQLRPDLAGAHNELGMCYSALGHPDQALEQYEIALHLKPDQPFARFNRAMSLLKQGRFREGWLEYEWRWYTNQVPRPEIPCSRWDGTSLQGRRILIHTEQGVGDVFQFLRFLPMLKQQGAYVVLACHKQLHMLLRHVEAVDDWFPVDEPGKINFELYAPLLSLPGLLDIDEDSIPCEVPYLKTDGARIERWRSDLEKLPGFKVGICWQGSPTFRSDGYRSIPLGDFAPLAQVPGVTLVSLQKGPGEGQVQANRDRVPLVDLPGLDAEAAFVDTAAVMHHLDLVISVDTAITHLAGALGRPVWVLLALACDWRWMFDRLDSPWYPTARLFRQKEYANWPAVMEEVAEAIRQTLAHATGSDQSP